MGEAVAEGCGAGCVGANGGGVTAFCVGAGEGVVSVVAGRGMDCAITSSEGSGVTEGGEAAALEGGRPGIGSGAELGRGAAEGGGEEATGVDMDGGMGSIEPRE